MIRDLTGGYTNQGVKGTFTGKYQINPDGGLVGLMVDSGQDILSEGESKIILGVHKGHMGRMNFLKLPNNLSSAPLMYTLENTDENNYEGFYVPLMDLDIGVTVDLCLDFADTSEFQAASNEEDPLKKIAILSSVERSSIEEFIVPQLIEDIVVYESLKETGARVESSGGTGYLTLK